MKATLFVVLITCSMMLASCSNKTQNEADFKKEFGVSIFPQDKTELEAVWPMMQKRLVEAGDAVSVFEQKMKTSREQAMSISADTTEGLEKRIAALRKCDDMESCHQELINKCEHLCDLSTDAGIEVHYEEGCPDNIHYGGYGDGVPF